MPSTDNPVIRHTGRLTSRARLAWLLAATLLGVILATGFLQQYWLQYSLYAGRPRIYVRWFYLFVLAEVFVVLPWSAVRGATVWRRLVLDGHVDEYRRTSLSPLAIVLGALCGSLKPVAWFLLLSAATGAVVSLWNLGNETAPTLLQTLGAHGLLLVMAVAMAALGQLLACLTRLMALAVPICFALLLAATGAIGLLNPYYASMENPDPWIWGLLLPNPAAAVGTLLRIDILRLGWIYEHVRAADYISLGFTYPSPPLTAAVYGAFGAACVLVSARRLRSGS